LKDDISYADGGEPIKVDHVEIYPRGDYGYAKFSTENDFWRAFGKIRVLGTIASLLTKSDHLNNRYFKGRPLNAFSQNHLAPISLLRDPGQENSRNSKSTVRVLFYHFNTVPDTILAPSCYIQHTSPQIYTILLEQSLSLSGPYSISSDHHHKYLISC
jgi:hypothetical protein